MLFNYIYKLIYYLNIDIYIEMITKMIEKDYAPGFFNKHFIKDMKIAKEVMEEKGEDLPILNKVLEMYEELEKNGFGDYGTQSIIEMY